MIIPRPWWEARIADLWKRRSILWLTGVRRAGKTILCQSIENVHYFDCELPSVRREMEDQEMFLKSHRGQVLALDEIHRLDDPALLLKIAADHFPETHIIATGSSTLGASSKFRDTLAGRKAELYLTPLCEADSNFPHWGDRMRRLLHGGLPALFLSDIRDEKDYSEWIEAFWARDILELFRLERRASFLKFAEMLFAQSGGRLNASVFASSCGVSRPTIMNYLAILEATHLVYVVRPYHTRDVKEIVSTPCVYAFDTGFVAWAQGLHEVPAKEKGLLWEHLVLNEIAALRQTSNIHNWRDKQGHEIDFVIMSSDTTPIAIEVKWDADAFEVQGLRAFRALHPGNLNLVVSANIEHPFQKTMGGFLVTFCPLSALGDYIL